MKLQEWSTGIALNLVCFWGSYPHVELLVLSCDVSNMKKSQLFGPWIFVRKQWEVVRIWSPNPSLRIWAEDMLVLRPQLWPSTHETEWHRMTQNEIGTMGQKISWKTCCHANTTHQKYRKKMICTVTVLLTIHGISFPEVCKIFKMECKFCVIAYVADFVCKVYLPMKLAIQMSVLSARTEDNWKGWEPLDGRWQL